MQLFYKKAAQKIVQVGVLHGLGKVHQKCSLSGVSETLLISLAYCWSNSVPCSTQCAHITTYRCISDIGSPNVVWVVTNWDAALRYPNGRTKREWTAACGWK